jgi:hypothetical protein
MNDAGDKLMSYDDFTKALGEAYKKDEWKKYIVNYLMMQYGVRNKDLNLEIVKTKKEMTDGNNYLLLKKDKVVYIRDDYKTQKLMEKKHTRYTTTYFMNVLKKQELENLLLKHRQATDYGNYTLTRWVKQKFLK